MFFFFSRSASNADGEHLAVRTLGTRFVDADDADDAGFLLQFIISFELSDSDDAGSGDAATCTLLLRALPRDDVVPTENFATMHVWTTENTTRKSVPVNANDHDK
jgi:hypothetical protein